MPVINILFSYKIFKSFFKKYYWFFSCWGDPHCYAFKSTTHFDNLGACKYEYVTTDCTNKKLVRLNR